MVQIAEFLIHTVEEIAAFVRVGNACVRKEDYDRNTRNIGLGHLFLDKEID
jgi:hypothetical protein